MRHERTQAHRDLEEPTATTLNMHPLLHRTVEEDDASSWSLFRSCRDST
ncbi:unnamed protein product [Amoebophrya sp. A25]|nr:unnamed protein product [Amoebophrya sp. A25]|eukprot:GSA25T00003099001.1